VVQEADVTREALRDVTQEERKLREYISVTQAVLDTANDEANEVKAMAAATQVELAGKLDPIFFGWGWF
jgi:hypothetical protein